MGISRTVRFCLSAAVVLASGALALAQDYTVTAVTGRWVTPPLTGTTDLGQTGSNTIGAFNNLPFPVLYYGRAYTAMGVSSSGYVQFLPVPATYQAYPYPLVSTWEGYCAPCQSYYYGGNGSAKCRWWVDGVAPDRRLIIAWTNYATQWSTTDTSINIQIQFNESTGRITMAYTGTWTATNSGSNGYGIYMDEASSVGTRFVRPPNGETSGVWPGTTGVYTPSNDWQFDPRVTSFTGTVKFDRLVADGTGVGNSIQAGVPAAGLRVDLKDSSGNTVGSGYCDANGSFTVKGLALVGTDIGSLAVTARSLGCVVRPPYTSPNPPTAPYSITIATSVPFNANANIGTVTIGAATDPGGTNRAPLNIAKSVQAAYEKVKQYTIDPVPELEVLYSNSGIEPTSYSRGGGPASASMRIAGPGSPNPDGWDTAVVQRAYAHHVLACIAAGQTTGFDSKFDGITDDQNAFAEGFGYYLGALLSGSQYYYDTTSSSNAVTINLENPQPSTRQGPDVTAWMAAALYDLYDGANEAWDLVDGAGTVGDRPIQVADALTTAPTASSFYLKWGEIGLPGTAGLASSFIHHGAVPDDTYESNNNAATATVFAAPGFRLSNMVLNQYDEDWFQFQLAQAATGLGADISADFPGYGATVGLELRNGADAVIATGVLQPGNISMRAVVPGLSPAGTYRVRVKHNTGARVAAYTVQAYTPLVMTSGNFVPWTVKRPYTVTLTAAGGVPPYRVTIEQPFVQPPGLFLDSTNLRVTGAPQQVGVQNFVLSIRDDGSPANVASVPQNFVVNDELNFVFGEFIAFPLGHPVDRQAPVVGGTAPIQYTVSSGAPPSGLQLDTSNLRFHGTPDVPGSTAIGVDGIDVAGSSDSATSTAVVAVPLTGSSIPVDLATGKSACGFFFDAVAGSTANVSVGTAKKRVKRAMRAVVLGPAGTEMQNVSVKTGLGKASVSSLLCPTTGRYYVILASDTGDATQLLGTLKLTLPKKGSGSETGFGAGDNLDVSTGVVAGAHVTLTVKTDKSGLKLRGNLIRDPSGAAFAFLPGEIVETPTGFVFSKTLATAGTWTFSFTGKPGPSGTLTWKMKIVQPKGVTYSAD